MDWVKIDVRKDEDYMPWLYATIAVEWSRDLG